MLLHLEFSLMQQLSQELEHDETRCYRPQMGSPITNSPPGLLDFYCSHARLMRICQIVYWSEMMESVSFCKCLLYVF